MFDFPNSPTNGQISTMPDGTSRKWDGTKWVSIPNLLSEAPTDGQTYGRLGSTTSWIPAAPIASPTFTGTVTVPGGTIVNTAIGSTTAAPATFSSDTVSPTSGDSILVINGAARTFRELKIQTSGANRWILAASNAAENGSNAGSDLTLDSYSDTAAHLNQPLSITRSTGIVNLPSVNISGGTIDGTTIGSTTPAVATFTQATVTSSSASAILTLNGATSTSRYNRAQTNGVDRWAWGLGSGAETGSNVGSDWFINRYADNGTWIDTPVIITRSNGIVTLADGLTTPNINGDQQAGLRNWIINGSMDFWQRGTSFANVATSIYVADRWIHYFDGTGQTTIGRGAATPYAAWSDAGFTWFLSYQVTSAGSGGTSRWIGQRIENVRTLAGKTITISLYANADANRTINACWQQYFGTGGSPSASVNGTQQPINITTTITRYSVTYTLPSIANKTVGTNNDSYLLIYFFLPINTLFTINITGVQVESGTVATPFEWRPAATEAALCQRYYQTGVIVLWAPATGASQNLGSTMAFVQQMRTTPTVTLSGQSYGNSSGLTMWSSWAQGFGYYYLTSAAGGTSVSANFTAAIEI